MADAAPNKEALLRQLLVYLNTYLETSGISVNIGKFSFQEEDEETIELMHQLSVNFDGLKKLLGICVNRGYLNGAISSTLNAPLVSLTPLGQMIAMSNHRKGESKDQLSDGDASSKG